MSSRSKTFARPRYVPWLATLLLLGCDQQAITPPTVRAPEFSAVVSDDPTRVITVGVDVPANVTVTGTVAGIVVAVDNAVVDLSGATVDCSGQPTPDDPRIGVWIGPGRSHIHIKGGGTGVIRDCGVGVLIGPTVPMDGEPGGHDNRVDGLVLERIGCPSGPWWPLELICDITIAVANSHDNTITDNHSIGTEWGIVLIGADPRAAASGGNEVYRNAVEGNGSYSFYVASNGNTVQDNTVVLGDNPYSTTMGAVRIDGDDNRVSGNTLAAANEVVWVSAGADDNTFTKNRVTTGLFGFWVEANTFRNIFSDNTALFIGGTSAIDRSGACVNNTWTKNAFMTTDPVCILAVTLDAVSFTSPTAIQLDGAAAIFSSTITNYSARLTDVALRSWVTQGPYTQRAGGLSLVECRGAPGVLLRGICTQVGDTLVAHNSGGGRGTLAVGSATALVELVRRLDGDTGVVDSRMVPITITKPAAGSYWELRAPMPTPRYYLGVGVVSGVLYAVGGYGPTSYLRTVEAYDPTSDSWVTRSSIPTFQVGAVVAAAGDRLYVVGGFTGASYLGDVEAYDPSSDSWSAKAPLPTPRSNAGAATLNGVLYVVGGDAASSPSGAVEAYDPASGSWTVRASLPTPRSAVAVGVVDGVLYAVGGWTGTSLTEVVEAYDPLTDSWTAKASLPEPLSNPRAAVVDGVLYVVSGTAAMQAYDPATNTWTPRSPMPTPRGGFAVGVVDDVLYTVGGFPIGTSTSLATAVEAYHP